MHISHYLITAMVFLICLSDDVQSLAAHGWVGGGGVLTLKTRLKRLLG